MFHPHAAISCCHTRDQAASSSSSSSCDWFSNTPASVLHQTTWQEYFLLRPKRQTCRNIFIKSSVDSETFHQHPARVEWIPQIFRVTRGWFPKAQHFNYQTNLLWIFMVPEDESLIYFSPLELKISQNFFFCFQSSTLHKVKFRILTVNTFVTSEDEPFSFKHLQLDGSIRLILG